MDFTKRTEMCCRPFEDLTNNPLDLQQKSCDSVLDKFNILSFTCLPVDPFLLIIQLNPVLT